MKSIKFLIIKYFAIKFTLTFGFCQSIEPSLSFKISSDLRVFENEDKLSPSVFNDILYIVDNYHMGGYTQAVDPDGPRLSNTPRNDFGDLYAINNKTGKILWRI